MDDLKVEDLLLMLLAQPKNSRNHSSNLDLFKTLFEREIGSINLRFNLISGFAIAIFLANIVGLINIIGSENFDTNFWAGVGIAIGAIITLFISIYYIIKRRERARQRYLDLIRMYYTLDMVT